MIHFQIENSFLIRFPNPPTKHIFSVISIYFLKQPSAKQPYNFNSYKPKALQIKTHQGRTLQYSSSFYQVKNHPNSIPTIQINLINTLKTF